MTLRLRQLLQLILLINLICGSCARNSSLTFVIDDTVSMLDDIEQVRLTASDIMDIVTREKAGSIKDVVLVTFNDPEVVVRNKTTVKEELLAALHAITPRNYGNYDCPEYALSGIIKALQESSQGSYLFVFTDASAKDYDKVKEVMSLCEKKQSQIVFVLTGDCHNPYNKRYTVYHDIALTCKGQVFRVDKDDVKDIINTIKETVKGQKTVVESKVIRATYNPVPVSFTVDDKTEYVIVSTSGKDVGLVVTNRGTSGGHLMNVERIFWKPSGKVVKFDAPAPGTYYAWVKGMTDISVMVYARTDFSFDHGFSEFVPKSLTDATKQPIKDRTHHLSISVSDPEHSVTITSAEIVDMQGRVLKTLPLRKAEGDIYITNTFVSPSSMFDIQVTGINKKTGNTLRRLSKTHIEPQDPPKPVSKIPEVRITEGTELDIEYGGRVFLTCKVSAYPPPTIIWTTQSGSVLNAKSFDVEPPFEFISYLNLTDVKYSGNYFCKASNTEAPSGKVSKIYVKIASPFTQLPSLSETTNTKYGMNKSLNCDISSEFPLHITWKTPINQSDYTLSGDRKVLTIKSVGLEAEGTYTCETMLASDPTQKHVASTKLVINDLSRPSIMNTSPTNIKASDGEQIKIVCKISAGIPFPKITWQVLRNDENVFRDLPMTGEELTINSAGLTDAGQYRCIAQNIKGQDTRTTHLTVNKIPVTEIEEGAIKLVTYGSINEMTCNIVGYPPPKVVWKDSRGATLGSTEKIKKHEITSKLKMRIIRNDTISCYAENSQGRVYSTINLRVTSPITVTNKLTDILPPQFEKPTDVYCNAKSPFPLEIKWFYQKDDKSTVSEIHTSDKYTISPDGTMLRILSTNLNTIGLYKCKAYIPDDPSQAVELASKIELNLSQPQLSQNDPKTITVKNDDMVKILCKVMGGIPHPIVSWQFRRKGDKAFKDVSVTGQELTLQRASLSDAGHYRCIAKNAIGQTDKTTELIVQKAPTAIIDEGNTVDVPYGSNKELKCKSIAFPLPSIVWKDSNGNKLPSQDTIVNDEIVSRVQVQNAKTSDAYTCYTANDLDAATATVKVNVLTPITFGTRLPENTNIKYGEPTQINCNVNSLVPINLEWFYQKEGSSEKLQINPSDKYTLSSDNKTLHITSPDLDLVGKYTCIVTVAKDDSVRDSQSTNVAFTDLRPSQIAEIDEIATIMNRQKMKARCTATGIPKPVVTWYFKPRNVDTFVMMSVQGYKISNPSVSYESAGLYKCIASNGVGNASRTIDIDVHGKPEITNTKSEFDGITGDKVLKISCNVTGVPEPTLTWKQGGKHVISDAKITVDKNAIFITNLTEKDSSSFRCEAHNKYGFASKEFVAVISDFVDPDQVEKDPHSVFLIPGDSADIKCRVPHSDPHSVRWYVNSEAVHVFGSTYPIRNAQYSNDGNYTCRVNTDQGSESLNTLVDVGYKPTFLSIPSSYSLTIDWNHNKDDNLDCFVKAKPKETVQWYYNGKKMNNTSPQLPVTGWGQYVCKVGNPHGTIERVFNVTSSVCTINRKVDKLQSTPLLIGNTLGTWAKFDINRHQTVNLACSTLNKPTNAFKIFPSSTKIKAQCDREDRFIVDGKTYKFDELQCDDYVEPAKILSRKPCAEHGEITEVGFQLDDGFLRVYDICVEDQKTVYTKTVMSQINLGNKVSESLSINAGIKTHKKYVKVKKCQYNQQSLVKPVDVAFGPAQYATLTDSSITVKVYEPCDDSSRTTWSKVENLVRNTLQYETSFILWSGASHYNSQGVPRYLWKVAKFEDNDQLEAIVFVNDPNPDRRDILCSVPEDEDSIERNLYGLEDLSDNYTYTCTPEEFMKQFKMHPADFEISTDK